MPLQACGLNTNREGRELQPHGTPAFPCAGYLCAPRENIDDIIPWHWHEELETILVTEGTLRLHVLSEQYMLSPGDIAIINSNALHMAVGFPKAVIHSFVFSTMLLTGTADSSFAVKYISPLVSSPSFLCLVVHSDELAKRYEDGFSTLRFDQEGYEFVVRDALSALMMEVYRQIMPSARETPAPTNVDAQRLAAMMSYIHTHYADKLTLKDIAQVCGISERETLRCFKRTIGEAPIQYLLRYRLLRGAAMLSEQSDMSISAIALACGFDSSAYFTKQFKTLYSCTPQQYRKNGSNLCE